jgi:hypothetical protein
VVRVVALLPPRCRLELLLVGCPVVVVVVVLEVVLPVTATMGTTMTLAAMALVQLQIRRQSICMSVPVEIVGQDIPFLRQSTYNRTTSRVSNYPMKRILTFFWNVWRQTMPWPRVFTTVVSSLSTYCSNHQNNPTTTTSRQSRSPREGRPITD